MTVWTLAYDHRGEALSGLLAMAAPPQGTNPLFGLLLPVVFVAIFYFIVLRPMRSRQQKVQAFIAALKVGDKVVTSGGIYGKITRLGDDAVQLEIAERVRVDVSRNAIVGYQGQEPVGTTESSAG